MASFFTHQPSPSSTSLLRFPTVISVSQTRFLHLPRPTKLRFPTMSAASPFFQHNKKSGSPFPSSAISSIAPFVFSEYRHVIVGWLCSAVSAYCLSRVVVPAVGQFTCLVDSTTSLRRVVLTLACAAAVRCAVVYFQQALLWEAALRSALNIRAHVFGHVLQRDLEFFEGRNGVATTDVAHRITAEAQEVADTVYALLNIVVPNMLQLVAVGSQMVAISPVLCLASALVIPSMLAIITNLGGKLREISWRAHQSVAKLSAYLNEVLLSMIVVKANNGELNESLRFQSLAHDDMVERLNKRKMKAFIPQIIQLTYIAGLLALCTGFLVISKDSSEASSLLSFIMSLALIVEPIQGAEKAYNEWKQGEPAIERLFELTRFKSKVTERPDAVDLYYVKGDIKFCNVAFSYCEKQLILNRIDLHIKAGQRIALIGPSGGGKTTLTKLLLRLYDPLSGCILVDDHDIQGITLRSLREHVGLVSQDIILFSGTVAENIGYRDPIEKIDMEQVKKAARIANADEFITALPSGYQTNIGQRGSLLSGGQKQRLAIARALYKMSSILILDEATSALDSRSEQLVRQALENLMANRTVVVVAHRMETILMADRVFLLDRGRLEEVPKHAVLAQHNQFASQPSRKDLII